MKKIPVSNLNSPKRPKAAARLIRVLEHIAAKGRAHPLCPVAMDNDSDVSVKRAFQSHISRFAMRYRH